MFVGYGHTAVQSQNAVSAYFTRLLDFPGISINQCVRKTDDTHILLITLYEKGNIIPTKTLRVIYLNIGYAHIIF